MLAVVGILSVLVGFAHAAESERYETVNGVVWCYTLSDGVAEVTRGTNTYSGVLAIPATLGGAPVRRIAAKTFQSCSELMSVEIPEGVQTIGESAFGHCRNLLGLTIPASVTTLGTDVAFNSLAQGPVEFLGLPPAGLKESRILESAKLKGYLREYASAWKPLVPTESFMGFAQTNKATVTIVSAAVRSNDVSIIDVTYRVKSAKPTVKVRAVAFEGGERSFAKVIRVDDLIEGTAANVGDGIVANVDHRLSWRAGAGLGSELTEVKFEVLAIEGELLPLELTTIPAAGEREAMEISWNALGSQQVFDALLWLYASKDDGLALANGRLTRTDTDARLADGKSLDKAEAAADYVFSKMGFVTLSGKSLEYANDATRLGLNPSGVRQYAQRTPQK